MNKNSFKKTAFAIALCAIMAAGMAGCAKNGDSNTPDGAGNIDSQSSISGGSQDSNDGSIAEGSVSVAEILAENSRLSFNLGNADSAVVFDEWAYYKGEGFQHVLGPHIMTSEPAAGEAIYIEDVRNDISKIVIGDKEYNLDDIVRDQSKGLDVVRLFCRDFGLNICDSAGTLIERRGDMSESDDLRSLYSDRIDFEDYSACAYYFDVKLNSFDEATYDSYRSLYAEEYNGVDTCFALDGKLGVVLYYDTAGHDYFYTIVISAPGYYNSEKNFKANMKASDIPGRKDITNCHLVTAGGDIVGITDNFTIMCGTMYSDSDSDEG